MILQLATFNHNFTTIGKGCSKKIHISPIRYLCSFAQLFDGQGEVTDSHICLRNLFGQALAQLPGKG